MVSLGGLCEKTTPASFFRFSTSVDKLYRQCYNV